MIQPLECWLTISYLQCDEQKPCGHCTRRGEDCNFGSRPSPTCLECAARESQVSTQLFSPSDWSRDLYLMFHYSASTSKELTPDETISHLWQYEIPTIAEKHPFLIHGLLAISALHLADEEPASMAEFLPLSMHHQNLAISSFRDQLSRITEENCDALFAQAVVVSMSCKLFSFIKAQRHSLQMPSVDDIIKPFLLTRGVGEVVAAAAQWIRAGPLAPMLYGHSMPNADHFQLPASTKIHFQNLRQHFQSTVLDSEDLAAIMKSMDDLERIYQELTLWEREVVLNPGTVWKWPNSTPVEYARLLQQHHPQALLLYAHFVMLSGIHSMYWYFRDWGNQAVTVIAASLPSDLRDMIQYPELLRAKIALKELQPPQSSQPS